MYLSVVILTYNSEKTIIPTIESSLAISNDVHVVDSYSSDGTIKILSSYPVHITQHPFENYAKQRNWAIENLPLKMPWELHLDADERLTSELIEQLKKPSLYLQDQFDGYYIARVVRFLGKILKHGGIFPTWHLRLFRRGKGRCEDRLYDQHFYVEGQTAKLQGFMIDDIQMELKEWIQRHNRWSDLEVEEIWLRAAGKKDEYKWAPGSPIKRKKELKQLYYKFPPFIRPFLLFFYRYFIKLGFLDGVEGLIFYTLQTFWFRFLIDAKLWELSKKNQFFPNLQEKK
ncbi:glycosyltransferase family 2 protein [Candidatus Methylacidiphilum fumarolicum]|uniref:Glycosyltransferase n=2 Tax=Candidatus Methylacidiphilum fumarolicum TaxID=591154 RepID=I0JYC4_METFB|nr:glycosyltransferase family 2 protein [Candidatus Methylacidiphilum fumarolicum]MBW6415965.1 glycosyltransferase family 2 protein [Candidatus Methylacidiphilum fumarolicum]TFE67261.1 glycosyl transferase [Candidatus Methylacidiphilum fumarolicum]TFE71763.1 glycosyltransferase family 2 protein [Candidatus Methylacidiphilum fumarolicum]TFE72757.1 glycosyltransferase family 2 protein [Candidatus Methylacidiphilum fumarolicum]TFE76262.1 glycosyl transferase [Candidatus Methylacidiphilum fumaroli